MDVNMNWTIIIIETIILTTVVRLRQLHIYRNGNKILVLAGKSAPKIIREDMICEMIKN